MTLQHLERLRTAGYKLTPSRRAVLQVIEQEGEHLAPSEILSRAQAIYPSVGRATVYRTLELLTQLQIVRPIYIGENGPIYIRAQGGHHHLVCSVCGAVVDFEECMAGEMVQELCERFGYQIQSHLLEFYGLLRELPANPRRGVVLLRDYLKTGCGSCNIIIGSRVAQKF